MLHLVLEGIVEVRTNQKGRFVSFKVTPSTKRVPWVYAISGYSTREKLAGGVSWKDKILCKKKEGNENKIILGSLYTQILYRCFSNYVLSKFIVNNGLEDLWIRGNSDYPEFTPYNKSFGKDPG